MAVDDSNASALARAIYDRAREGLDHLDLAETAAGAAARVQRFVARIDQAAASEPVREG